MSAEQSAADINLDEIIVAALAVASRLWLLRHGLPEHTSTSENRFVWAAEHAYWLEVPKDYPVEQP